MKTQTAIDNFLTQIMTAQDLQDFAKLKATNPQNYQKTLSVFYRELSRDVVKRLDETL